MSLTRRGWSLVVITAVLAAVGGLFGIQELLAVATATAVILVSCAQWVRRRPWTLRSARQVTPTRVPAGSRARVELVIRNRSARRSPVVAVRDPFDGGRHWAAFAVAPLEPGETVRTTYSVPTRERGVFELGPLDLEMTDPFGLVVTNSKGAGPSTLTVHPRIVSLGPPRRSSGSDQRPPDANSIIGAHGSDFYAVREYRTGDDLRRVHWASTARLGELMIRQEEAPAQGRLTVAVDLREVTWAEGGLETALAGAASVADATLGNGLEVRLVTTAGVDTGFGTTTVHRSVMLDALASARAAPASGSAPELARLLGPGPGEAVVVVTSGGEAGRSLLAGYPPGLRRLVTAVLISPSGATPPAGPGGPIGTGITVITVPGGIETLPGAWARCQPDVGPGVGW